MRSPRVAAIRRASKFHSQEACQGAGLGLQWEEGGGCRDNNGTAMVNHTTVVECGEAGLQWSRRGRCVDPAFRLDPHTLKSATSCTEVGFQWEMDAQCRDERDVPMANYTTAVQCNMAGMSWTRSC